jgi:hypothetical protein
LSINITQKDHILNLSHTSTFSAASALFTSNKDLNINVPRKIKRIALATNNTKQMKKTLLEKRDYK